MVDAPGMAAPGRDAPGSGSGRDPTVLPAVPRRLLAGVRDVMAGSGAAQRRLDKIVMLIAAEMNAEVCSCYVMRAGDILELFSTVGLNQEAVHHTRLRVSEGLGGGKVRGVLVIQHKDRRSYSEEDVETLQTVAMVVAELVAAGELVNAQEI